MTQVYYSKLQFSDNLLNTPLFSLTWGYFNKKLFEFITDRYICKTYFSF